MRLGRYVVFGGRLSPVQRLLATAFFVAAFVTVLVLRSQPAPAGGIVPNATAETATESQAQSTELAAEQAATTQAAADNAATQDAATTQAAADAATTNAATTQAAANASTTQAAADAATTNAATTNAAATTGGDPSMCGRAGDVLTINAPAGSSITIGRSSTNFNVSGGGNVDPTCGGSTVTNINTVFVNGTSGNETITVDTLNGNFEPGASAEGVGISEIEFSLDLGAGSDTLVFQLGSANDKWTAGVGGINPNGDLDADITLAGIEILGVEGGLGNDQLSAGGKKGTGGPYPIGVTLLGRGGKDTLTGGLGHDLADGGDGNDSFKALNVADGDDNFFGRAGTDTANYGARRASSGGVTVDMDDNADDGTRPAGEGDNIHSDVENVVGSKGDDMIDDGGLVLKNSFKGGYGNDNINAVDGVNNGDIVDGGAGAADICSADPGELITNCP